MGRPSFGATTHATCGSTTTVFSGAGSGSAFRSVMVGPRGGSAFTGAGAADVIFAAAEEATETVIFTGAECFAFAGSISLTAAVPSWSREATEIFNRLASAGSG